MQKISSLSVYTDIIVLAIITILIPFLSGMNNSNPVNNYSILSTLCAIIAIVSVFHHSTPRLTKTDILVLIFLIWVFISSFIINKRVVSNEKIALWLCMLLAYWTGRCLPTNSFSLSVGLAIGGLFQSIIAWFQYLEIIHSNHPQFIITGSFPNPGPLGAYLGLSIISICYLLLFFIRQNNKIIAGLLILSLLNIGWLFIIAFSRASWLSLMLVSFYFIWKYGKSTIRTYIILLFIPVIMGIGPVYLLKKDSADGRLFIWKVSWEMLKEAPIIGKGGDSFTSRYMFSQASFFEKHPCSEHAMKATDNVYAFNEYIRIGCEYGIIGTILWIILIVSIMPEKKENFIKSILLYVCIFSFFSYTTEIPILAILLCLTIGILATTTPTCKAFNLTGKMVLSSCYLALFNVSIILYFNQKELLKQLEFYSLTKSANIKNELIKKYPVHQYNRAYILTLAHQLYRNKEYPEALSYLSQAEKITPVSEILLDLGNCNFYLGNILSAEFYFNTAHQMVPGHILPLYYLFRLYVETGQDDKAHQTGIGIVSKPFKQEGSIAIEVKHNIHEYLSKHSLTK